MRASECAAAIYPIPQLFTGTVESAKEHRPPRAMPQLVEYFKAIKVFGMEDEICAPPCGANNNSRILSIVYSLR